MRAAPLALLLLACAAPRDERAELEAGRPQVVAALYRQLDLVLARQAELARSADPAAEAERAACARLAVDIAVRIASVDPDADLRALVARVREAP
jgi:hypothetical protein